MRRRISALLLALALAAALCAAPLAAADHMSNFRRTAAYVPYKDVWSGAWYQSAAKTCYEYGLMQGTYGKFNPKNTVSVAEVLAIADRIHEIYTTGKSTLKSGSGAAWYRPYVNYAVRSGIIAENTFDSYTRPATRAEIALIYADTLPPAELHAVNGIDHLSDVPRGTCYYSVLLLYNAGVLTGSGPDCRFRPGDTITRAEMAAVTARMIVPKMRRKFYLLDAHDMSALAAGLTVYLPGEARADGAAAAVIENESKGYRCYVLTEDDSAARATDYTPGAVKERLAAQLARQGETVQIATVRAENVTFGKTAAYRYQCKTTNISGGERLAFAYAFVRGGKMCYAAYTTARDSGEFRTAVDALTLDGAAHS